MCRRIVSLLLLPGLLLSQAAAAGHAHGDHTPADHSIRPHVHTLPVPADRHHAHGHHHHGPGGHHHHHDDEEDDDVTPSRMTSPPQPEPPSDHDADAVFVSTEAVAAERPMVVSAVEVVALWVIPDAQVEEGGSLVGALCRARNGRPPPHPDCPLYVRHLALLM